MTAIITSSFVMLRSKPFNIIVFSTLMFSTYLSVNPLVDVFLLLASALFPIIDNFMFPSLGLSSLCFPLCFVSDLGLLCIYLILFAEA